jgi:dipeptidyl aminopeptidase/acylaminoacyl peptidase
LPFESFDARTLYYKRSCYRNETLLARPTVGGEERTVLSCAVRAAPAPRGGVLYLECPREGAAPSHNQLRRFDEATGENRPVATIEGDFISDLSVSADGQTILYGLSSWGTSDLMMIENFR